MRKEMSSVAGTVGIRVLGLYAALITIGVIIFGAVAIGGDEFIQNRLRGREI